MIYLAIYKYIGHVLYVCSPYNCITSVCFCQLYLQLPFCVFIFIDANLRLWSKLMTKFYVELYLFHSKIQEMTKTTSLEGGGVTKSDPRLGNMVESMDPR